MIEATEIRIEFSESKVHQDRGHDEKNPKVFKGERDCWILAQAYLNDLAHHGPQHGGYDKTDVVVKFSDGSEYQARLDIQHFDGRSPDHDLAKHIRDFCGFYGGTRCPSHLTEERYRDIIGRHEAKDIEYYRTFLDKYAVPAF